MCWQVAVLASQLSVVQGLPSLQSVNALQQLGTGVTSTTPLMHSMV
jgi:hypothetical protein